MVAFAIIMPTTLDDTLDVCIFPNAAFTFAIPEGESTPCSLLFGKYKFPNGSIFRFQQFDFV